MSGLEQVTFLGLRLCLLLSLSVVLQRNFLRAYVSTLLPFVAGGNCLSLLPRVCSVQAHSLTGYICCLFYYI